MNENEYKGLDSLDFTRTGLHQEVKHKDLSKSFIYSLTLTTQSRIFKMGPSLS